MKRLSRILACVLTLAMLCALLPAAAVAESEPTVIRFGTHWVQGMDPHFIDESTGKPAMTDEAERQLLLQAEQAVLDAYNVKVEYVQYAQDTRSELVLSVLAGNPVCDVALMWGGSESTVLAQNILQPLDDYVPAFEAEGADWMLYDKLYGHNYFMTSNQRFYQRWPLIYNITMIEKVDTLKDENGETIYPTTLWKEGKWTWSTFQDYLSKIQAFYANTPAPDGSIHENIQAYETDYRFAGLSAMFAAGGGIYSGGAITADSEASIKAVQYVAGLKEAGLLTDPDVYSDGFVPQWCRAAEDFQKGSTVFTDCPDWWIGGCCSNATERGESVGLMPWPRPDDMDANSEDYRQVVTVGDSWGVLKGVSPEKTELALKVFRLYWNTYYQLKGGVDNIAEYKDAMADSIAANLGLDIFHEKCGDDVLEAFKYNSSKCVPNDNSDIMGLRVTWDNIIGKGLYGVDGMPAYEVAIKANMSEFTKVTDEMEAILGSNEINDNQAPNVKAGSTVALPIGSDIAAYDWASCFTVEDGFDGVIDPATGVFKTEGVDAATAGSYKVKGIYADKAGNEGSAEVTVVIYDANNTAAPILTAKAELPTVKMDADAAAINWKDYVESAVDATGLDVSANITADIAQLDTTTPGEYPVTLTVKDYVGNEATVDITVKVVAE